VRLFFALLPDAVSSEHLSRAAETLELAGHARLVIPRNLHITLAFVGDVSDIDMQTVHDMRATLRMRRCAFRLDSFEYWSKSQAIVLTVQNNPIELCDLARKLRDAIAARVHRRHDDWEWRAHVTLARKVAQATVLPAMSPILWVPSSFSLVRSDTGQNGSVYTVVDSWPLLDRT